jgi:predicted DNA-binding transcriptional regulator YafY
MSKVDRLERLTNLMLVLLGTSRPLTLRELADAVPGYPGPGDARRQAFERDKRILRDEGITIAVEPVDGPDQLGYRIRHEDYYIADLDLSPDEQVALNLAVAAVHQGEPRGREALWRLGISTPVESLVVADLPDLPALPVLHEAIRTAATVAFDYHGSTRRVEPAVMRFRGGWWYLIGYDLGHCAARTFRVDRMESLPVCGQPGSAALPEGFDADKAFADKPWLLGKDDQIEVDVLVDPIEAPLVLLELGEAAVLERRGTAGTVFRIPVTNTDALRSWVLGLGHHARVLSPPDVRAAVLEWLHAMAGYEEALR